MDIAAEDHAKKSQALLLKVRNRTADGASSQELMLLLTEAQVHATLAIALKKDWFL